MKIAISVGHGQKIRGARGNPVPPQLDEVDAAKRIVDRVAEMLGCPKFFDTTSTDQSTNLHTIVNWHNKQTRELDVSVHLNCYDHSAHGTEVLYVTQEARATKVCNAICAAIGTTNRGAKLRSDLYFLNSTSKPAVLLEVVFCDHTGDCKAFNSHFEAMCEAIAESCSDQNVDSTPPPGRPERPERPQRPENPYDVPLESRPMLDRGDEGPDVEDLQQMLPRFDGEIDGDFGPVTEDAVTEYQRSRGLDADGIVGDQTWAALYAHKPPVPPPPPPPGAFTIMQQKHIVDIANSSEIAEYDWKDRGRAPVGYTQGMALAFAQTYRKLKANHPAAVEMAQARKNSDKDALNLYRSDFSRLGLSNERSGADTLRNLYALLLGHGMRESSGRHCEGVDQSVPTHDSVTSEAGLFQTSYNAHSASDPEFNDLMEEYAGLPATCYLDAFEEDVSCSSSEWKCYGSGDGYKFQELCKECPAFAVETCALTLRNLCNHYGPIIRHETELRAASEDLFKQVQDYVDGLGAVA